MNAKRLELVVSPMRAILRSGVIWAASIGGIIFLTVAIWPAFKGDTEITNSITNALPSGVVQAFGLEGFGTPAGFLRGNLYDFFIPLLMAGAAVGFANTLTAGEEDAGRLEVTLAQPVTRQAVFLGRTLAVVAWVLVIALVATATQFVSDAVFDLRIAADRLLAALVLSTLLALFTGSLTLAVAGLGGRSSLVLGVGLLVAIGGCIVAQLFPLASALAEFAHVSPWDWAFAGDPLVNGAEIWRYLALGVPAILLILVGTWAFVRRDVSAA